jgi:drug/metabolite transporter (DMT)-like permease
MSQMIHLFFVLKQNIKSCRAKYHKAIFHALLATTMLLGFVAYGMSIYYYTYAQRIIGAARTSAYYAVAPFIGVILSMIILNERPNIPFFIALIIMLIGTRLASTKIEE